MNHISPTNLKISLYESGIRNEFKIFLDKSGIPKQLTKIFTCMKYPIPIYKCLYMNQVLQPNLEIRLYESGIRNEFTNVFT